MSSTLKSKTINQTIFSLKDLQSIDKSQAVHVVLSGGGAKGIAHVAFLQKLEELGIRVHSISATSAGTLVGGMYASGVALEDIRDFFINTKLFYYSWMNLRNLGFFKAENYQRLFRKLIKPNFSDLNIPLYVTATNLQENRPYYFHEGDLHSAIVASCAVPAIFNPVKIDDQLYADGGVMDNFPIFPFQDSNRTIVGSYVSLPRQADKDDLDSIFKISHHSSHLIAYSVERHKFDETAYTAIFPLAEFSGFDGKKVALPIYNKACEFLEMNDRVMMPPTNTVFGRFEV